MWKERNRSRYALFNIVKIMDKKNQGNIHKPYVSEIALLTFCNVNYYAAFKMCGGQGHLTLWKSVPTLWLSKNI